jgi:hypothetical protein
MIFWTVDIITINCNIKLLESIIFQTKHDIQQKVFKNIQKKFSSIIIKDIQTNQNQNCNWSH